MHPILLTTVVNSVGSEGDVLMIEASRSILLLVDLQSKLTPAIADVQPCLDKAGLLLSAARTLDVPVLATEHCPGSIGVTVSALRDHLNTEEIFSKTHFDASAEAPFLAGLKKHDRPTIVVAGTETHVCVLQTVLGLKGRGLNPVLVADATSSRTLFSRDSAIERMRHHGIDIVTSEMVIFEWLQVGGTPAFKKLLPAIKAGRSENF